MGKMGLMEKTLGRKKGRGLFLRPPSQQRRNRSPGANSTRKKKKKKKNNKGKEGVLRSISPSSNPNPKTNNPQKESNTRKGGREWELRLKKGRRVEFRKIQQKIIFTAGGKKKKWEWIR